MQSAEDLHALLRRYWGYDSFRPLQEAIVRSVSGGADTCVVMPTGGGKSLCYQLPALVSGKTSVVVSPLIALMQDQATQLEQMGIPAAVLNSTQSGEDQAEIYRNACAGKYRLLYLSPERLARQDTVAMLKRFPLGFFAIDEAHCISEWGHEFRPDYRQLSSLREHFPAAPIAAFTASATRRVRHDILHQLKLHNPHKYIASFHRDNLRYLVRECAFGEQTPLLLAALSHHQGSNVIVYAPTIACVEETSNLLNRHGIAAVPYHGQMEATKRRRNQERWMSDEVRVLVGTIAFGLGINKAAVRAVIHLSLPKSIEQYYQEAGRAGRDGLTADCLLLWQKRDAGLLAHFIGQVTDPIEKERGWQRYHAIRGFVESKNCRHREICLHFGETPKWTSCEACDVCVGLPEFVCSPEAVKGGRGKRQRASSSHQVRDALPTISGEEEALREYLREWRRTAAREGKVAAFVVMHDSSLDEICRRRPQGLEGIRAISGFGDRKTERYGDRILQAIREFDQGSRAGMVEVHGEEGMRQS